MLQYVFDLNNDPRQQDQHVRDWANHIEPGLPCKPMRAKAYDAHIKAYRDHQVDQIMEREKRSRESICDLTQLEAMLRV